MSTKVASKPLSPGLRFLRAFWAALLISLLVFSVLMAAWGDLREGLMLKVLDDRYNKSFTLVMPHESHVWAGELYLGESQPHSLAVNEPEDTALEVEHMSVLEPRVYIYEEQVLENAVACEDRQPVVDVIAKLAPDSEVVWSERGELSGPGFVPALLRNKQGRLDFVNLARVDWSDARRKVVRAAFLVRMEHGDTRVFSLENTVIWSDRLFAPKDEFWPRREQYDDFPPGYSGQVKTVWQWHFTSPEDQAKWLKQNCNIDATEINWAQTPPKQK